MTTSGVTAYDRTGAQIAEHAARLIRIIGVDETLDTTAGGQEDQILESLNLMIKSEQTRLGLWRYREGIMFLVDGTNSYTLPPTASTNYACDLSELSETTLDADEASGQTVISVASTSGFTASDVILIVQDDDTIHASTIDSFVADDTVTIYAATTAAASSGNKVYVYTNSAPRPLKVVSARRLNSGNEIQMFEMSREEYFSYANKTATGTPTQYFYDPQQGAGKIYLWPTPSTVDDVIRYTYLDELEIINANTDTSNFPQEWMEYLVYNLAIRIASMYGVQVDNSVLAVAAQTKRDLELFDQDEGSIYFGVA